MTLHKCLVFVLVTLASSARIQSKGRAQFSTSSRINREDSNTSEAFSGATCYMPPQGFPNIPSITESEDHCNSINGWLVVACVKAEGLKDVDTFSKSDPFCRVRISDSKKTEKRGWWDKYHKYPPVSDKLMVSTTIQDNLDPEWNQAFSFHFLCPQEVESYQLEVSLKDEGTFKNTDLGWVFVNVADIVAGKVKEGEDEYRISHNLADPNDKRKFEGSATLMVKWCEDRECVKEASSKFTMKGEDSVECSQSCHRYLGKELTSIVKKVHSKVREAQQADANADHYDDLEDHYEDQQEYHEDWHNHEDADEAERLHEHYKDLEDHYEHKAKKSWMEAVNMLQRLVSGQLTNAARATCGPSVVHAVQGIIDSSFDLSSLKKKFKGKAAKSALSMLIRAEKSIKDLNDCLEFNYWNGNTLPKTSKVSAQCQNYFTSH